MKTLEGEYFTNLSVLKIKPKSKVGIYLSR